MSAWQEAMRAAARVMTGYGHTLPKIDALLVFDHELKHHQAKAYHDFDEPKLCSIVLDTSGSISNEELDALLQEIPLDLPDNFWGNTDDMFWGNTDGMEPWLRRRKHLRQVQLVLIMGAMGDVSQKSP